MLQKDDDVNLRSNITIALGQLQVKGGNTSIVRDDTREE